MKVLTATQAAKASNVSVTQALAVLVSKGIAEVNPEYSPENNSEVSYNTVKHVLSKKAWLKGFQTENVGIVARADVWAKVLEA